MKNQIKITSKALIEQPLACLLAFLGGPTSPENTPIPRTVATHPEQGLSAIQTPLPYQDQNSHRIPFKFEGLSSAELWVEDALIEDFLLGRHCDFVHGSFDAQLDLGDKIKAFDCSAWRRRALSKASQQIFSQAEWATVSIQAIESIGMSLKQWTNQPEQFQPTQQGNASASIPPLTAHRVKMLCFDLSIKLLFGQGGKADAKTQLFDALWHLNQKLPKFLFANKGDWPNWFPNSDYKAVHTQYKIVEQYLKDRIRERIAGQIEETDILNRWVKIVEDKKHLNEDNLILELLSVLCAINFQLSSLVEFALWYLSEHEEYQSKLKKDFDKWNHKLQKSIDAGLVYKELLRLVPPAYWINYQIKSPWQAPNQAIELHTNDYLFLSPWVSHRQSKYFTQPERFWPQRWLGNLEMTLSKMSYCPFGFEGKDGLNEHLISELFPRILCGIFGLFSANRLENINRKSSTKEIQPMQNLKLQYELGLSLRPKDLAVALTRYAVEAKES